MVPLRRLAEPAQVGLTAILGRPPPSTSGLGRHPFKVVARVRSFTAIDAKSAERRSELSAVVHMQRVPTFVL